MTTATVSRGNPLGLPPALNAAQEAIHFPEVQEMLRKLSMHGLGIFMPHMHDEQTGEFQPLPDQVTQVESGLAVSFQPADEVAKQTDQFLPVGWVWRAAACSTAAACDMIQNDSVDGGEPTAKHKMPPPA